MAIVKLSKITLLGQSHRRDEVLERLQELGCIHLIDPAGRGFKTSWQHPTRSDVHEAVKYLEACPNHRPPAAHRGGYEPHHVAREVLANKQARRELIEEREQLVRAIEQTRPWGDFRFPNETELAGNRLWFFRLRHRQSAALNELNLPWSIVSRDYEFDYAVVIAAEPPESLPVAALKLDSRPLSALQELLEEVDLRLESLDLERLALTRWTIQLKSDLTMADDETVRMTAAGQLISDEDVFALQGWVAHKQVEKVQDFARQQGLALTTQRPTHDDQPPTLLTNPPAVAGAEGAVTFYRTPNYRAWDPTWIMYFSFSLFFAMIMADAGYGLVLAVILGVMFRKMGKTRAMRRFRYLALFMVAVTIGYGVLIGSYFGISPSAGTLFDRFVWKSGGASIMEDREAMMLLAAGIGVVHLTLANLVVAWQRLGSGRALSHVGWASAFVGGLVMAIAKLPDPALVPWMAARGGGSAAAIGDSLWQWGSLLLAVGLGMVFFFSSDRPVFSSRVSDWLWRPLEGLMGLTNISKAFGDALSYLRLFALGLASAQLAITFNQLASDVSNVRGIGLFLGLLVFIAGHSLNLVLGIVGGVVHGLRLNCIEFFSWSLTDEGYPFHAFRKKADC